MTMAIIALLGLVVGMGAGYIARIYVAQIQKKSLELELKARRLKATEEGDKILAEAKEKADAERERILALVTERDQEFKKTKEHLEKRETILDERQIEVNKGFDEIKKKTELLATREKEVSAIAEQHEQALERISKLTREEAHAELIKTIEQNAEEDLLVRVRKMETFARESLEERAKDILATTIHRLASSTASAMMTTNVPIANEEVKGKIIGKEGRNIRTFERVTGVELLIDESPDAIIISSFDPVRREIARVTLENLIADGRIQPAKIEEFFDKAKKETHDMIKKAGEDAVHELGIYTLDPRIIAILGRLHFRTSYGQNVLRHSIEMAHIAEMIASEIGADPLIAKTGALVHDIGKALDHEFEGGHLEIGIRILRKFGTDERVVTAMKSHHETYPYESLEAIIVHTADIISGGRPGARRDTVENYLKRLKELEAVANSFSGVEKSYALQAGREIRVFVTPDSVTDIEARQTARDMAIKIEKELRYPGEIKITVIRENRIIEFAR